MGEQHDKIFVNGLIDEDVLNSIKMERDIQAKSLGKALILGLGCGLPLGMLGGIYLITLVFGGIPIA